ncbi:hypothetical protein AL036_22450 [Salipiger aestuarii]|uniref:hypothetical protein n=1 Tax=Salipiger aestuarii TaxID=568098 RepID=UPI00025B64B8|nr:hypothetical protein [Salipiger aestuarii]EIE50725.1 hypothetical protein C357_12354 [Citreicella sp. 357]KAA8603267.1 hypothetical protein AL036_22450 [Salipiger aestuarii]KAA8609003.1 hypothetical protein AL037_15835 [Salipiger aestuarii]
MFLNIFKAALAVAAGAFATGAVLAAEPQPIQQHNSNAVWFENWLGLSGATMKVVAPDGQIQTIEAQSGTPVYRLDGRQSVDGVYRYEISAATGETVKIVNPVDNGRGDQGETSMKKPFYMTGHFVVSRNVIITPEDVQEE